jgi:Contractile injection system tube protein
MNLLNLFKLEKLKLEVYKTRDRTGIPEKTLQLMFNPESYSLSYKNEFSKSQGLNTSGKTVKYILSRPAALSLKIIIDGTGASEFGLSTLVSVLRGKDQDVYDRVHEFLTETATMDGTKHEPKFVKIIWGKLNFDCRLRDVTVNYTLFDRSGNPLRAELDTSFIADAAGLKLHKKEQKTSPDLTHRRTVKEHDTLPLLCESVYGTPDYYLQVVKANKLVNFRKLTPGTELFFPPVNK